MFACNSDFINIKSTEDRRICLCYVKKCLGRGVITENKKYVIKSEVDRK